MQDLTRLFHYNGARGNQGIEHKRTPPKTPNMNVHIESFHRLLEDACLSSCPFKT
ncbi:integrase core domain-containing protein [Paraliobacillus ryukyuensis]|uniref:integrase core domain-containing protein n=1 Tax=Paraliobacillus ryukyuensis TaxID=200904 RepID=UPI000DE86C1C